MRFNYMGYVTSLSVHFSRVRIQWDPKPKRDNNIYYFLVANAEI